MKFGPFVDGDEVVLSNNKIAPAPPRAIPKSFRVVIEDPKIKALATKTKMGLMVIISDACKGLVNDNPLKKQS